MRIRRRHLVAGASAALLLGRAPFAAAQMRADVDASVLRILAGRMPVVGPLTVDAPAVAENGAQVPMTVRVESPMTDADHVTAIHIIANRNPVPEIGTFRLTPQMGRAQVFTRIRVAEAQQILVFAELSNGTVLQASADIAVSIGGCST